MENMGISPSILILTMKNMEDIMGICLHGFKMDLTMNLMVVQWNMIRMTWMHNIDRLDWIGLG